MAPKRHTIRYFTLALVAGATLAASHAANAVLRAASSPHAPHAHRKAALLTPDEQVEQIVDRFSFGPTPGMLPTVEAGGWEQWFDQQLHPDAIPDAALVQRLAQYPSLAMSPEQLAVNFPDGGVLRRIATGKQAMPSDPKLAAVYAVLLARYGQKQAKERAAAQPGSAPAAAPAVSAAGTLAPASDSGSDARRAETLGAPILALPPANRLDAVLALPLADRVVLTGDLRGPLRAQMLKGVSSHDRDLLATMSGGLGARGIAANELQAAKVLRAVLSRRQLQEVMTDFWMNHFNIELGKTGDEIDYANQFEGQAIRPHALGKFRDLLLATAQSPAMMIYLDNITSIGPDSPAAQRQRKSGATRGLNENYGRELMELHTVGVNGGYTQADVTALSAILTGWTVERPQDGGPFTFEPRRHQPGPKQWMGHTVDEGGEQEGIDALTYLADSPATARHISTELAQRFVGDAPPPALVDRMVAAWKASDGNISAVLTAMVHSPEFFSRAYFHNKVKSPLEFVASAIRAAAVDPTNPGVLVNQLRVMGEPLYRCLPPTGYPNAGSDWMNSAALVDRLNFALALGEGRLGGMRLSGPLLVASAALDITPAASGALAGAHPALLRLGGEAQAPGPLGEEHALALIENTLLDGEVAPATNRVIESQIEKQYPAMDPANPTAELDTMAAMVLGSPGFQVH